MKKNILKTLRVTVSLVVFILITFYFMDFAGLIPQSFHRLMHIQLIPALLSWSVIILLVWVVLTLLFGRVYCSSICPLGTYQDVAGQLSERIGKKKRYTYSPAKTWLRLGVVAVVVIAFLCGFGLLLNLADPYSAYGRVVINLFKPLYLLGNNLLESVFSSYGNYTFYQVEVSVREYVSFGVALLTLLGIGFLAWKNGRTWCNTICPVGTTLGVLSRFSLFRVRMDPDLCNGCGKCTSVCKASCINSKEHTVDHSRCVACFNCLDSCRKKALSYSAVAKKADTPTDTARRRFLMAGVTTVAVTPKILAKAQSLATGQGKAYETQHPITPPGSVSREHFQSHCTACHLCVGKCPSRIIKPAFMEYGLGGVMQPTINFEKGFCNFDCTVCGDICPNGAIQPLTVEEKHLTQMGYVVFIKENCIVYTDGTSCGACSEHCPTQAIAMIPYKDGLTIPEVDRDICVGCGGCEYVCPARPYRAVHIEGNPIHLPAKPFEEHEKTETVIDDFGF